MDLVRQHAGLYCRISGIDPVHFFWACGKHAHAGDSTPICDRADYGKQASEAQPHISFAVPEDRACNFWIAVRTGR